MKTEKIETYHAKIDCKCNFRLVNTAEGIHQLMVFIFPTATKDEIQ